MQRIPYTQHTGILPGTRTYATMPRDSGSLGVLLTSFSITINQPRACAQPLPPLFHWMENWGNLTLISLGKRFLANFSMPILGHYRLFLLMLCCVMHHSESILGYPVGLMCILWH